MLPYRERFLLLHCWVFTLCLFFIYQGVSQEGKKFYVLHKLVNKRQLAVWGALEALHWDHWGTKGQSPYKMYNIYLKDSMVEPFRNNQTKIVYFLHLKYAVMFDVVSS